MSPRPDFLEWLTEAEYGACYSSYKDWERIWSKTFSSLAVAISFFSAFLAYRRLYWAFAMRHNFVMMCLVPGIMGVCVILSVETDIGSIPFEFLLDFRMLMRLYISNVYCKYLLEVFTLREDPRSSTALDTAEKAGEIMERLDLPMQFYGEILGLFVFWIPEYPQCPPKHDYKPNRSFAVPCVMRNQVSAPPH